jgi:hypothetical protein
MKPWLLAIAAVSLVAQDAALEPWTGTVADVGQREIALRTRAGVMRFHTDAAPDVRRGEQVRVMCDCAGGKRTAVKVSRQVTVSGVVAELSPDEMVVESRAGRSACRWARAAIGVSARHLKPGLRVHVVGWDADGAVEATRIAVYETDVPAQTFLPGRRR